MKRIFFYAKREDIIAITQYIESFFDLSYVLMLHDLFPEYGDVAPVYNSASLISNLGVASRDNDVSCERYLVTERSVVVVPIARKVGERTVINYEIGNCRKGISFRPAGLWGEDILLSGLIETWSDDREAQKLMRKFLSSFKKFSWQKIHAYWVGPAALDFLKAGGRLTIGVSSAPSFDLKLPQ